MKNVLKLNAFELQEMLLEITENGLVENYLNTGVDEDSIDVNTFKDAGLLTKDCGLVLRLGDRVFQITIVRSK